MYDNLCPMNNIQLKPAGDDFVEVSSIKFSHDDIHLVVKSFYGMVAKDRYLQAPFNVVEDWPYHVEKLTHFWWIRFGGRPYFDLKYDPVQKHYETGFSEELLDIWLTIFKEVLQETLTPPQAQLWSIIAQTMGDALNSNNELMKLKYGKR